MYRWLQKSACEEISTNRTEIGDKRTLDFQRCGDTFHFMRNVKFVGKIEKKKEFTVEKKKIFNIVSLRLKLPSQRERRVAL